MTTRLTISERAVFLAVLASLFFFFAPAGVAQVVINEVLYRVDPANSDPLKTQQWVELVNKGAAPVNLTGWKVSGRDGASGASARPLPAVTLAAQGYLVLHLSQGTNGANDFYTQDANQVWNPNMDEVALYATAGIVDFIAWGSQSVPYSPGTAHNDAVTANIWTPNAALASDGVQVLAFEKPRPVALGMSIGRDPDSTDTDTTGDFEPHGGVGALDNSPNRQNLDQITIVEVDPPATPAFHALATPSQKKWTVMFYFNADNSLEKYIYDNVQEIERSLGSDNNVNYVVMYDGKRFSKGTQRGLIPAGGGDPTKLTLERLAGVTVQIGERDMGDPNELAGFISWVKANYPADHYALILSAHGDGWKSYGPDETSQGTHGPDYLYMGELRTALAGQYFDLIGFDACMMAGIEVADQLHGFTSYFVASEEVIPGYGFPYDTFTAALKSNPTWTGLDLGKNIVKLYASRYQNLTNWTLSLIDEQQLTSLVQQMNTWSGLLKIGAGLFQGRDDPNDNVQVLLKYDRAATKQFSDKNFVDLYDLAQRINNDGNLPGCIKTPIPAILNLLNGMVVVTEVHSSEIPIAKGMHIYFPRNRKQGPESYDDYDLPYTRQTNGNSHFAIYAENHDMLPLKSRDREDGSALDPATEWPEPVTPGLQFTKDTDWSKFLERYYHPVADNHILYGIAPSGMRIYPASSGGGACSNPTDSIAVPTGSTVYFSAFGSSDADQADFQVVPPAPAPPIVFPIVFPSYYFWDLNGAVGCTSNCIEPQTVPPGSDAALAATTNMDADRDLINTTFDQKDAAGPTTSWTCAIAGTNVVTLMVWDDNHLKRYHDTNPTALYVHPQTDSHQATISCSDLPPVTYTGFPTSMTLNMNFTVTSDPFDSASFVGLSSGNATATFSGLGGPTGPSNQPLASAPTGPQVSLTGDRSQLVPATGPFDTVHNSFSIQGTSTSPIAGFQAVQALYTLTLGGANLSTVTGTYQVGLNSTLNNEAQPVTYNVTGTIANKKYPAAGATITAVNTAGAAGAIAQNTYIEIHGTSLVPATTPAGGVNWNKAPEFATGHMPTQLNGVSVTVNGKPAFVYFYCSAATTPACKTDQLNVLTPLDGTVGTVPIVVTSGATSSAPFMVKMQAAAPSFLLYGADGYVVATHLDNTLVGPTTLYPGYTTPAKPGETLVFYAVGFGLPSTPLVNGSSTQSGTLASMPVCRMGSSPAIVSFAGLIGPGLYQLNIIVPANGVSSELSCTYQGVTTPAGDLITIQPQ
jgi:uncharacterized protein (TIGR03437 family)